MSLDTVIKIGKLYREHPDAWKYHEQINKTSKDVAAIGKNRNKDGDYVKTVFYEIPVIEKEGGMCFDLNHMTHEISEVKQDTLYYLNFKTSKKDTSKKYLFGDIVYAGYTNNKNIFTESGNYRMAGAWEDKQNKDGAWVKKSSFWVCEEAAAEMNNECIRKFREEFRNKIEQIERLLKSHDSVVIHFNFNGKSWLELEGIIETIDYNLTLSLVEPHHDGQHVVLTKYLYKTLGGVSPGFDNENIYKSRFFTRDEIISLLYAGSAAETPVVRLSQSLGILVLPHIDKNQTITPQDLIDFYKRDKTSLEQELDTEERKEAAFEKVSALSKVVGNEDDSLFGNVIRNNFDNKIKYDLIFTNIPGSPSGVFADLIELPNIEKSNLIQIHENIRKQKIQLENRFREEFPAAKHKISLNLKGSFANLFGDVTKEKKKLQSHLLKVLPKIYTDSYYSDPVLLPALIEKTEYGIRNGDSPFNLLKYHFYFLSNIQKHHTMNNPTTTQSFQLGQYLGILARPFASWRDDCPIKAFEKQYFGTLTRRICSLDQVSELASKIMEKLTMHMKESKSYINEKKAYIQLVALTREFSEKYNKYNCALGFFESFNQIKDNNIDKNQEDTNN